MAARVNSRFVVILAVVLSVAFVGVALVGLKMVRRSSEQLAALGDQQMAAGNYKEAANLYAKAVNKDQQNPEMLRKWISALERLKPEQFQEYRDRYYAAYLPAIRALADVLRTDVAAHRRYLGEVYARMSLFGAPSTTEWKDLAAEATRAIAMFPENDAGGRSLRRYRALANLGVVRLEALVDADLVEQTRQDFQAALEADGADAEAAAGLAELDAVLAERARKDGDTAKADRLAADSAATLSRFLERHPGSPAALMASLRQAMSETVRAAQAEKRATAPLQEHAEAAGRLVAAVLAAEPGTIDLSTVLGAATVAARLPDDGPAKAVTLIEHALRGRPDHPLLLTARADVLEKAGKYEEAIGAYQRLLDLPDRPVSLEGLLLHVMRGEAAAGQLRCALAQYPFDGTPEAKKAVLDRAREMRGRLVKRVGEQAAAVRLADAQIKVAEGDVSGARIVLTRYTDGDGARDRAAIRLLAELLLRTGDTGEAKRRLERLIELEPANVWARAQLATLALQQQEPETAERHLAAAVAADPSNKDLEELLSRTREWLRGEKTTDPVLRRMIEIGEHASQGDLPAAIGEGRRLLAEYPGDVRVIQQLVANLVAAKDRAGAQEVVEAELARSPESKALQSLRLRLRHDNPLDLQLASIDATEMTPLQKHLAKALAYLQSEDKVEQAWPHLEEARALDPGHKGVVELAFIRALRERKFDQAQAIADQAARENTDGINGLSFVGRLRMAQERYEDGAAAFQQATEIDRLNSLVWRNLGACRLALKQYDRAIAAFERALESRPNDAVSVRGLIHSSFQAGRLDEALEASRKAWKAGIGPSDPQLIEVRLLLEATAPTGDKEFALSARRQLARAKPEDRQNRLQMAALLVQLQRYDEARTILDQLKASPGDDAGAVADLEAQWHVRKGDMAGATRVFTDYIASLPADAKRTDEPYVRRAAMLSEVGQYDAAIGALREGMKYQDPVAMGAERQLAATLMRAGRWEEALETLRRLLASVKEDPGNGLLKAVIQCQVQLSRYAEAESTIHQLGEEGMKDQAVLILAADAAAGRRDLARARRLIDQAVALSPTQPAAYFVRAQYIRRFEPDRLGDAEQDLRTALERDPRFSPARELLFAMYNSTGRPDQAMSLLREAVAADPDNDQFRSALVSALTQRQQHAEAAEVVAEALRRKPDSIGWALRSCDTFIAAKMADRAVGYLRRAWDLDKSVAVAIAYSEVLAEAKDKNLTLARDVLSDPAIRPETNFQVLLQRAKIYHLAGRAAEAEADLAASFRLLDQNQPEAVNVYFAALLRILPSAKEAARVLDRLKAQVEFKDWALVNDLVVRTQDKDLRESVWPKLREIAEQSEQPGKAYAVAIAMAAVCVDDRRYEEAARWYKRCIEINDSQADTLNNYAYIVGEKLDRPAEGLPHAEKAAGLAPGNIGILDTLGTLQMRSGALDKADATLGRALSLATNIAEKAPVYLHLAELRFRQGNQAEGRRYADLLEEAFRLPDIGEHLRGLYGDDLAGIRRKFPTP